MIIPAIDILNNKIVRLYQGKYDLVQYYDYDIYNLIENYLTHGAQVIHIVDLAAARDPDIKRNVIFNNIMHDFKNFIQLAGGIRSHADIERCLLNGAKRVVIGSAVINQMNTVKNWIQYYGNEYIVAALDIHVINNKNYVFIHGWSKNTNICLEDILQKLSVAGIKYVLCTDISKDGTLLGPNFKLYKKLVNQFSNICFQSSGGVSKLSDITELCKIGISGMIIGKSLLDNKFSILEAMQCWQKGSSPVLM
ncbi:1-(5-phosphoribosyl)-5-[(5-phosphoribosylamino)methylideneamino] imidazole-4-carboxamide isomerase [Buchnera aphidicola]|uniref:1-(5-phosphoribosyl)-5-[(5-phosphoribosylamino)methylideneamino] imidazole-4-carboxamide isomerase n=1 Tax=Buchnera aphidicola (Sarucallis kahawaluokalani) TaxID=1241878 RepID=A0A4D6YJ37_9GAMM|nr:1-(5-phosphoribosyl)-5-[(5-phosphoribosylamino)methylideneamino] imidazole-4-carboxamide isomerase [Buchnera aphidicola]QCI25880.1 1-(5-phosphoribosyl)-5-[(5-phosphoribosylamino)methylideneamino] imidazole-4-carboxamide isomerase [Buchnera aphidicola (Sarucallis kahawaluokalani)]